MNKTVSAPKSSELTLRISRVFAAPRSLVFRMWAEKHLMDRWSCPTDFTIVKSGAEFKEGASWHATMRAPDGADMSLTGIYKEIIPDERMVFTHAWLDDTGREGPSTLVTVTFEDDKGRTRMELHQTGFDSAGSRDGHEGGWTECLGKFVLLLDAIKASDREFNITRLVSAPLAKVFAAFSEPAGLAQWWGPNGFTTTTHKMDFHAGGTWVYTMHGPDGTGYPNHVTYTAIETNRSIAYDHGSDAEHPAMFKAIISFTPQGGKTKVTLRLILADASERPAYISFGAVEGGYQNLARLDAYLGAHHWTHPENDMTSLETFTLSRDFNAARPLLFSCFADAERLAQWWGPKGVTIVKPSLDFRPGGLFHYGMEWVKGGPIMWGRFVFREITAPERIVFINSFSDENAGLTRAPFFDGKWPLEMLTVFAFEELGPNRSRFTLAWTPENATDEECAVFAANFASAGDGWSGSLEKLENFLASL